MINNFIQCCQLFNKMTKYINLGWVEIPRNAQFHFEITQLPTWNRYRKNKTFKFLYQKLPTLILPLSKQKTFSLVKKSCLVPFLQVLAKINSFNSKKEAFWQKITWHLTNSRKLLLSFDKKIHFLPLVIQLNPAQICTLFCQTVFRYLILNNFGF